MRQSEKINLNGNWYEVDYTFEFIEGDSITPPTHEITIHCIIHTEDEITDIVSTKFERLLAEEIRASI